MDGATNGNIGAAVEAVKEAVMTKTGKVTLFSSISIALYGYDQDECPTPW